VRDDREWGKGGVRNEIRECHVTPSDERLKMVVGAECGGERQIGQLEIIGVTGLEANLIDTYQVGHVNDDTTAISGWRPGPSRGG
jgi:hypothetical protein